MNLLVNALFDWRKLFGLQGFLLVALLIVLVLFILRQYRNIRFLYKPRSRQTHSKEWLQLMHSIIGMENDALGMQSFAGKFTVVKKIRNKVIQNAQWRIYLNLQYIRIQLHQTPAQTITMFPASLWLFENYNLVYREIKKLQSSMDLHAMAHLPVLTIGGGKGFPRVYLVAHKIIVRANNHLREDTILRLLQEYQQVQPLTSRELWAMPNLLSLCVLERLVDEAIRLIQTTHIRIQADEVTERVANAIRGGLQETAEALKTENIWIRCQDNVFLSQFIYRLRNLSLNETEIVRWLATMNGLSLEDYQTALYGLIQQDRQHEALTESIISALITSLKEIGKMDWDEGYRQVSLLEAELEQDPAAIYHQMDIGTRGRYRRRVEKLSKRFRLPETYVAAKAIGLARAAAQSKPDDTILPLPEHVGSYLVGDGRSLLVDLLSDRPPRPLKTSLQRNRYRVLLYLTGIAGLTALILLGVDHAAGAVLGRNIPAAVFLCLQLGLLAVGIAIQLTHAIFSRLILPKVQLSMDFQAGIPDAFRTFVVMPVILESAESAHEYASRLEKFYLANKQDNLYFAVLGDLKDAPAETVADDAEILEAASGAMMALNEKYSSPFSRFSLLIRRRKWNERENSWMCWERKRGKLEELNAMLSGEEDSAFTVAVGTPELFSTFRYVITLDADTELIRDSASLLVGIMAHPLNQPVIDPSTNRVTSGFAIVQSEIASRVGDARVSFFSRVFAGESGIDSYASVISDVYQDTFDEGIFVGKGIYDFRVLHRLLRGVIEENTVLSHDLLESSLTRCAFASGVRLLDGTPPNFAAYALRDHRWIRGDWQLLPWILRHSPINWLSRWKMTDNLRRSLSPVASVLAILANVAFFPQLPFLWLPFVLFGDAWRLVNLIVDIVRQKMRSTSARIAFHVLLESVGMLLVQSLLYVVFLPYRAWLSLDAIVRTLYRMAISHRHLLEWQTSESVEKRTKSVLTHYIRMMAPGFVPAILLGGLAYRMYPSPALIPLMALAVLWFLAPWIAWQISKPTRVASKRRIAPEDEQSLRLTARKTWRFFEEFSSEETHWLCPDNYQLFPGPRLSDKTSPTNIGMQLISALSACDLGFITLSELVDYCDKVMQTVLLLPKWNGHLYNWYQVHTLEILSPHFVSAVDSGNFLAHLITLKNGLLEWTENPLFSETRIAGLRDSLTAAGLDPHILTGSFATPDARALLIDSLRAAAGKDGVDSYWRGRLQVSADHLESELLEFAGTDGLDPDLSLAALAKAGHPNAGALLGQIQSLCTDIDWQVTSADFSALYDYKQQLFYVGYNVSGQMAESGHYDLLASEARVTSFLAIAKGDVPQKHWFALGRPLTMVRGIPALVSWSGTMFEYLMPNIILKTPRGTLLFQSCAAAVDRQMLHGRKRGIPWGISESQYFMFDPQSNYQYSAFGSDYLRLQSSMRPARVVTPYATALALDVKPDDAVKNLNQLIRLGATGTFGFFESLDFNRPNAITQENFSLVQSYMAHHQGMILASINNYLNGRQLQRRFHKEPMVKATEVLLEENRTLILVLLARYGYSIRIDQKDLQEDDKEPRVISVVNPSVPVAHVISNNHYLLMLTSDGQGFSSCDNTMLYRWRPDPSGEKYGNFVYIRNLEDGHFWSNTFLPVQTKPDEYQALFSADNVSYRRRDGHISTRTDITVSPIENLEIRRVTFTNHDDMAADLEATSYLEVINDRQQAEISHPAFSKLFLQMEYIQKGNLLLATRRSREETDHNGVVLHMVRTDATPLRLVEYETDRRAFIGRSGTKSQPRALMTHLPLAGRSGFSTDPILSLRVSVRVPAGGSVSVSFITAYCPTREAALRLGLEQLKSMYDEDLFRQALTSSNLELRYLGVSSFQHNAIQNMVGPLYYPTRSHRDAPDIIRSNQLGQSSLWRFGISGDDPILLLRLKDSTDLPALRDTLAAYEFLRQQTVRVDLVLINEEAEGYALPLQNKIQDLTSVMRIYNDQLQKPSLFMLRRSQMTDIESILLSTVARIVIPSRTGIYRQEPIKAMPIALIDRDIRRPDSIGHSATVAASPLQNPSQVLEYYNGVGGFTADGSEYEILQGEDRCCTPAPWINVIANPDFGFHVSETGAGYTWAGNSRENKLTTWSNDPMLDPASEAVYLKDVETGAVSTPSSLQPGREGDYRVRHGFGYSVFTHTDLDLRQSMTLFTGVDSPVKIWLVTVSDLAGRDRQLSLTLYVEWVLGVIREQSAPYVSTGFDEENDVFLAENVYSLPDHRPVAFLFGSEKITSHTGDRQAFLGFGRTIVDPGALDGDELSGEIGAGFDPCGAIQYPVTLQAGETRSFVFGLGQAANPVEAVRLADLFRRPDDAQAELDRVQQFWRKTLGQIQVQTPDRSMDLMLNGWLLYQTISCRLFARSAFYQSGGAIGFRDQLQDTLALLHVDPHYAEEQIRLCSTRQFTEGDVQHWWHPDSGSGVRTLITDDLLWLPFAVACTIERTGRTDLLHEKTHYLKGEPLHPGEAERMFVPERSRVSETIYRHCLRAIDHVSRFGSHGLPLMGGGDWNDGMNRVGIQGKGESVWLGWFYYTVLKWFAPLCLAMDDPASHEKLLRAADTVRRNLDDYAWDGRWFLRAFFDDGSPLGTQKDAECQIDSISQSWAVLSGAASPDRALQAIESANSILVHQDIGLVQLLTPPFNLLTRDPGYIRGYYPGIRENGGQYTHAAIWLAMANAGAGKSNMARDILSMINPINLTATPRDVIRYEREPYVMSADIYMGDPFTGKAGWSWYTGSAGWMYQAWMNSHLGILRKGDSLILNPSLPTAYPTWQVNYRNGLAMYCIRFINESLRGTRVASLSIDGVVQPDNTIQLQDDHTVHEVLVKIVPE